MDTTFDYRSHVSKIGHRLVREFGDARMATSPSAVGDAMEEPVRKQLENILPRGIGVGSGFVIDTFGHTSRQVDIVLYEKETCPVFSINKARDSYFPCECVIAVGEVKSRIDRATLADATEKIASVKRCRRRLVECSYVERETGADRRFTWYRFYSNASKEGILRDMARDPGDSATTFGFILAGETAWADDASLARSLVDASRGVGDACAPSLLVALTGVVLRWGRIASLQAPEAGTGGDETVRGVIGFEGQDRFEPRPSAETGDVLGMCQDADAFRELVRCIRHVHENGMTSHTSALDHNFRDGGAGGLHYELFPK